VYKTKLHNLQVGLAEQETVLTEILEK
jgi:hypothetical protein